MKSFSHNRTGHWRSEWRRADERQVWDSSLELCQVEAGSGCQSAGCFLDWVQYSEELVQGSNTLVSTLFFSKISTLGSGCKDVEVARCAQRL